MENAKLPKFKCDILRIFKTICECKIWYWVDSIKVACQNGHNDVVLSTLLKTTLGYYFYGLSNVSDFW